MSVLIKWGWGKSAEPNGEAPLILHDCVAYSLDNPSPITMEPMGVAPSSTGIAT